MTTEKKQYAHRVLNAIYAENAGQVKHTIFKQEHPNGKRYVDAVTLGAINILLTRVKTNYKTAEAFIRKEWAATL